MRRRERATTVFRFIFFGVFGGDPGYLSIWSGRSAMFGFVQVCSGLFGVCRSGSGNGGGLTARVDIGVDEMAGAVAIVLCFAGVRGWGGG